MFRDGPADVIDCAVVSLFLHATSGGLSQTVAFSLRPFLGFIALNTVWPHFLGTKLFIVTVELKSSQLAPNYIGD